MRKKIIRVLSFILLFLFITGLIFIKPAFKYLSGFLSKSEKVDANLLVVEGWLPDNALQQASEEFKNHKYDYLITTGIKTTFTYFGLYSNGFLVFYPGSRFAGINENSEHRIGISAYSDLGGENRAHLNILINDSLITDFFADKKKHTYTVNWIGALSKVDSISVQFDNDGWGKFGDRNLFVESISIDDSLVIPYMNNSSYIETDAKNKRIQIKNFYSNAELARGKLISMGIDSAKIIATPGDKVKINRTLTSVLAFRDWIKKCNINITGINVFSMGTHARRTWMTYNKILNEKYRIGIISVPYYRKENEIKVFKILRETLGILYYWFILIPY